MLWLYALIALGTLGVVLGIGFFLRIRRCTRQFRRLNEVGELVRFAAYRRICENFIDADAEDAKALAVAAVDELFGQAHKVGSPAEHIARSQPEALAAMLQRLKQDRQLLEMASHTLSAEIGLRWADGEMPREIEWRLKALDERGLSIDVGTLSAEQYLTKAEAFIQSNAR